MNSVLRSFWLLVGLLFLRVPVNAQDPPKQPADDRGRELDSQVGTPLPQTLRLEEARQLDELMVSGISQFALHEISLARQRRRLAWSADSAAYYRLSPEKRNRFSKIIGVVDDRIAAQGIELISTSEHGAIVAQSDEFHIYRVRWPVLKGVTGEGYWLLPTDPPIARVVLLPDANWNPEMMCGLEDGSSLGARPAGLQLAALGCEVLIPTLINRETTWSHNDAIGKSTDLSHREFVYRPAFEVGRHILGYEVQKALAAFDQLTKRNQVQDVPLAVIGAGDGAQLALYCAALDERIDAALVAGYFDQREQIWKETIDRNVWGLLEEFGDAELASLIFPRKLTIEIAPQTPSVLVTGSTAEKRSMAAPGKIEPVQRVSAMLEVNRLREIETSLLSQGLLSTTCVVSSDQSFDGQPALAPEILIAFLGQMLNSTEWPRPLTRSHPQSLLETLRITPNIHIDASQRQRRMVGELIEHTQNVLRQSSRDRAKSWSTLDRSSVTAWEQSTVSLRSQIHETLIGRLDVPQLPPNPRSRLIEVHEDYLTYDILLDVDDRITASGVLLLPNSLKPGEQRPVVVCQHGLEGTPYSTLAGPGERDYAYYKAFSVELAKRGYIVYAPQNPYRGGDRFRAIQRQSNPLARSLFSYIIAQHAATLRWLSTLPQVEASKIAFYGLSYGGKTAMRVPPFIVPTQEQPGYCMSICSGDFNSWVAKNASVDEPFSYVYTGEYEIFEWNMGHVADYAELAMLICPRPFMVERGHDDGVGIDEWVASEYAKVRRHYVKLGLDYQTEIEFFLGPHTIHGRRTFEFLDRHLRSAIP